MNRNRVRVCVVSALLLGLTCAVATAAQYTAYSLKVAQQRIEKAGVSWREKEPEVFKLAGISRVEGFVYDRANNDLILVGEKDETRAALTLDDLAVALRARFRYNEWPLVSIDPTPDTKKTEMQHVRFEGGIEDTEFGKSLYEADYRLKEISFGTVPPGIPTLKSVYDRDLDELQSSSGGGSKSSEINSRLWFYPINPHVVVREGVCVVRGLNVGVFTEVMSAKVDGNAVVDVRAFKSTFTDAFASDVNSRFEDLCKTQPSFNRMRGLQELVAVSKALEEMDERPDLSWWVEKYQVSKADTAKQTKVLRHRYDGDKGGFELSGGVHLTALVMRLNAGDVSALREAVLKVRTKPDLLSWDFVAAEWIIPLGQGQAKPEDVAGLFQQAIFLQDRERHAEAISIYDEILKLNPNDADIYYNRGIAYHKKGDCDKAVADYNQAISINPEYADAYDNRGVACYEKGEYDKAIADYNKAISINQEDAKAYYDRGNAYYKKCEYDKAIADYNKAISINQEDAKAYNNRGNTYYKKGEYDKAIADHNKAISINPEDAKAYYNRAMDYCNKGNYDKAIEDFNKAISINPEYADAYDNRGVAYYKKGDYDTAVKDWRNFLELEPEGDRADWARKLIKDMGY